MRKKPSRKLYAMKEMPRTLQSVINRKAKDDLGVTTLLTEISKHLTRKTFDQFCRIAPDGLALWADWESRFAKHPEGYSELAYALEVLNERGIVV